MPVIKSAMKKLRQDKKRRERNLGVEETLRKALKNAKKTPTAESVRLATKATDKAVKNHLMHPNKAARVKSGLSKLLSGKAAPKTVVKAATKANKKATVKKSLAKKTSQSLKS